jgi:hypothetical protein
LVFAAKLRANSDIAEDNMNVQLKDITVTARDGRVSHLDQVYIRGSHVRFFIVPDMLRYFRPPQAFLCFSFYPRVLLGLFYGLLYGFFNSNNAYI